MFPQCHFYVIITIRAHHGPEPAFFFLLRMDEPWFFPKALQKEPTRTPFGLCPNVWVDLEVINPNSDGPCDFRLRHPEQIALQLNLDKSKLLATSKLSPISDVTCHQRRLLRILFAFDFRDFCNLIISLGMGTRLRTQCQKLQKGCFWPNFGPPPASTVGGGAHSVCGRIESRNMLNLKQKLLDAFLIHFLNHFPKKLVSLTRKCAF